MRPTLVGVLTALLSIGVVGCTKTESPKGGPGKEVVKEKSSTKVETGPGGTEVRKEERTEVGTDRDTTFAIKDPGTTRLNQGESKKVTVSIDRGRKFDQAVKLTFKPDAGIKVEPATAAVPPKENKVEVTVAADTGATVGTHSVEVTGAPDTGAPTSLKFAVEVKEKK